MSEEKKITHQEYWQGFPEAPASDNFRWVDGAGFEHQTTIRAWTGAGLYQQVAEMVARVLETGGRNLTPPAAPPPASATATAPAPVKSPEGVQSIAVKKIKVTPEVKDGKPRTMVELFAEGHQWADIKAFYDTPSAASAAFGTVTGLDFAAAGEYSVEFIADYRLSEKKNSKGNPYKNLVNVRES